MTDTRSLPFPRDVLLEHRAWVRALARSLVRDPAAAEDLEQDTWVRALESMPSETRSPRAWLATVLRNRFRDTLRTRERRAGRERRAARTDAHRAAADIAMAAELHREVLDAVLALDEPFRDVALSFECDSHAPRRIALDEHQLSAVTLGDIVLDVGRTLRGRVVDLDGHPVPRASVFAEGSETLQISRQGQTDDEGRFVFEHVADEPHELVAQGPDGDSFSGLAGVLRDVRPSEDEVVVAAVRAARSRRPGAAVEVRPSRP